MISRMMRTYTAAMILATAALAGGYLLAGLWWGAAAVLLVAVLWLWGDRRGKSWAGSLGLATLVLLAAVGSLLSVSGGLTIVAVSAGLVAWDIGRFNRLLAAVDWIHEPNSITSQYRKRLLTVVVVGALIAILATVIRLNFSFGVALLLTLVSVIGFSRAISYLRQESA